jgi:hypothetical protein
VVDLGGGLHFDAEALERLQIDRHVAMRDLESDEAAVFRIVRLVNAAKASASDRDEPFKAAEV